MVDIPEPSFFLRDLFPQSAPELLRLFDGAIVNGALLPTAFYPLRDWLELADYCDRARLPALLLVLRNALEEGSFCTELAEAALVGGVADLIDAEEARGWANRIAAGID